MSLQFSSPVLAFQVCRRVGNRHRRAGHLGVTWHKRRRSGSAQPRHWWCHRCRRCNRCHWCWWLRDGCGNHRRGRWGLSHDGCCDHWLFRLRLWLSDGGSHFGWGRFRSIFGGFHGRGLLLMAAWWHKGLGTTVIARLLKLISCPCFWGAHLPNSRAWLWLHMTTHSPEETTGKCEIAKL